MNEYLKLYPSEEETREAMVYAFGLDETEKIMTRAVKGKLKIRLIVDEDKPDFLDYELVPTVL